MVLTDLTEDDVITDINIGDKNVELVAFVSSVNAPITVGKDKTYDVFKFMLTNKKRSLIQCAVWNEDINTFVDKIKVGSIIYINGAWAVQANSTYNRGNVPFELSIKKTTIITIEDEGLGTEATMKENPKSIRIEDFADHIDQFISLEAVLKSPFQVITQRSVASFGCAAVCSNDYKLEIRVSQFSESNNFKIGETFKILGIARKEIDKFGNQRLFLQIHSMADMKKVDIECKNYKDMIKCIKTPKRKMSCKTMTEENTKKLCEDVKKI